ncbi:mitochondrial import inner membrane translocase subunit TIM16-like [Diorhabda sublineata]|uniref:mitochondrial import inner membrane translocase subunit TIM16-like n=1 Tax=Diorhabda sublineata TaxID=1163346 RepID=UPI0024E0E257|nr:mitochondrial import inner membrane translocase subunit TIM16-like [Diorhabda sublineata]
MVKTLPKIIYHGVRIFFESLKKSIIQEIALSQEAARLRYNSRKPEKSEITLHMPVNEAKLILNVKKICPKEIETQFKHLFECNSNKNGGSFYLQSKIVRAKEVLDLELKTNNNIRK